MVLVACFYKFPPVQVQSPSPCKQYQNSHGLIVIVLIGVWHNAFITEQLWQSTPVLILPLGFALIGS